MYIDLNKYIKKSLRCSSTSKGLILDSTSSVDFDFCDVKGNTIEIYVESLGGDGKYNIKINDSSEDIVAYKSKKPVIYDLKSNILSIKRTNCLGKILLSGINIIDNKTIELIENLDAGIMPLGAPTISPIKKVFIMLGEVKDIDFINDEIIAKMGGKILNADNIDYITTSDDNSYEFSDGSIIFTKNTKILSFSFKQGSLKKNKSISETVAFGNDKHIFSHYSENIIFNIKDMNIAMLTRLKPNSVENTNSGAICLKANAEFYIPVSEIDYETDYLISINCQKLSGNGKITCMIVDDRNNIKSSILLTAPFKRGDIKVKLNSGIFSDDSKSYFLKFVRNPISMRGDVLFYRMSVIKDAEYNFVIPKIIHEDINKQITASDVIRKYTIHELEKFNYNNSSGQELMIDPLDHTSCKYISKLAPLFNISTKIKNINIPQSKYNINIGISNLDCLSIYNKLIINEYSGTISSNHSKILESCEEIYTPSLINYIDLKRNHKNVHLINKYWANIDAPLIKNNKFIYFEKDPEITKEFIDAWGDRNENIIIVGSRLPLKESFEYFSEYESYESLYKLIIGSRGVIDIGYNFHYSSGILNLCKYNNINIYTNNYQYFTENNDNIFYIGNNKFLFNKESFRYRINDFINSKNNYKYNSEYNKLIIEEMRLC